MRVDGEWYPCDDGLVRPVVYARVRTGDGSWCPLPLLVDSGADQSIFAPEVLGDLRHTLEPSDRDAIGVGGRVDISLIETTIRLHCHDGTAVSFTGRFGALTQTGALETSVLGRDILDFFALILDRGNDAVILINQRHQYRVVDDQGP